MATRAQIRTQSRALIAQTDANNTTIGDAALDILIDTAVGHIGSLIEYPRSIITGIQAVANQGNYDIGALSNRVISILDAYFGDRTIDGDLDHLAILKREQFSSIDPSWYQTATGTTGKPARIMLYDRSTIWCDPKPSAAESASGKKFYVMVSTVPIALASDSSEPDLPLAYHNILQFYVAHLAYAGPLANLEAAGIMEKSFDKKRKELESAVTKESDQFLQWTFTENEESNYPQSGIWVK